MDDNTSDVTITYTSHRYWRIIFPLFVLVLVIEYLVLFFMYPASANLGMLANITGVKNSINGRMNAVRRQYLNGTGAKA